MNQINLTHRDSKETVYQVYFVQSVSDEIERILNANFCNMTLRPYQRWLRYFYATVQWIHEIDQWLSLLTYGYIYGSILLPNAQYQHSSSLGTLTYQKIKGLDGKTIVLVTNISFNPFIYKRTRILMEKRVLRVTNSKLQQIIEESIKKVLNIK